ncbi:mismatch-specific DNA-glycosylase [Phaeovulum sp.]|uniref:mismatch-specific DNA-glycosylase n=1 Tax=Phaeovulum sp. TaxID=2934796 RepID=UPI00356AC565
MLPDLTAPGLDLLFCGTAPGLTSAARGHYYARPGNRFWPMLAETGMTPRLFRPDEDHRLPALGLGLTDLARKGVAGQDRDIPHDAYAPARLAELVARIQPRGIAFTSLTAARLALGARLAAGLHTGTGAMAGLAVWVLPSPSGLARSHFRPEPWQAAGAWLQALRQARAA